MEIEFEVRGTTADEIVDAADGVLEGFTGESWDETDRAYQVRPHATQHTAGGVVCVTEFEAKVKATVWPR